MTIALFILIGLAACGLGSVVFLAAKGAPHEIEALVLILIGSVFLVGAGIMAAVDGVREAVKRVAASSPPSPPAV
jgi:hypothetical protein